MLEKSLKRADKEVFITTRSVVLITARIVSIFISSTTVHMYDFSILQVFINKICPLNGQ